MADDLQPLVENDVTDSQEEGDLFLKHGGNVQERPVQWEKQRPRVLRGTKTILIIVFALVSVFILMLVSFGGGVLLGWNLFNTNSNCSRSGNPRITNTTDWGGYINDNGHSIPVTDYIAKKIQPDNIKDNLKFLTPKPHIAGKVTNSELARSLYTQWRGYGFDRVEMSNYSVLLDYVDRSNYNVLKLQDRNGNTIYTANTTQEKPLVEGEDDPDVPPPFNAYSGVGKATGPLVYVNYGAIDDFIYLTKNLSLNLTGHICIARYGTIFRGNKAHLAQLYGCSGLIIYSDPHLYAPSYGPPVFPDGPMLPPTGLQRGSLMLTDGDPLTPGLPSIDNVTRRSYQEAIDNGEVPSIPVQPISYGDAIHFLRQLSEHRAPEDWRGGLDIHYHITQTDNNTNVTFIEVNQKHEEAVINDVVGMIYGSVEPDHLVILGNHRDAWTFGSVDPNSGTSVLMEIARILGDMKNKGWRPGRTIILCSWDAEEYGLIGSTEWVEHYQKLLDANTVAYINVDVAISGNSHFKSSASPLLFTLIRDVTKEVPCPGGEVCHGFNTLYDQWKSWYHDSAEPYIGNLGSGSDFTGFVQLIGVSAVDLTYASEDNFTFYAVYHSVHDNFYWSSHFGDPDFTLHKAIGEVWSRLAMVLVTTPILPYDPTEYSLRLTEMLNALENEHSEQLKQNNVSLSLLEESIKAFSTAATKLKMCLGKNAHTNNSNIARILNKKLLNLERAFIQPQGLPGTPYHRHVISAPSSVNSYAGGSFPGVTDAIFNAQTSQNWVEVSRQISIVAVHIMYATQIMEQRDLEWL